MDNSEYLPNHTTEERVGYLRLAQEARHERAETCRRLKRGEMTVCQFLSARTKVTEGTRLRKLVMSVPGYGVAKAERLLVELGLDGGRRVSSLGPNQRACLVAALD